MEKNKISIILIGLFLIIGCAGMQQINEATGRNGIESPWGKIEGANRYRIEPMAQSVLCEFSNELLNYLKKVKANANW